SAKARVEGLPLVLCEGQTDVSYITKALQVLAPDWANRVVIDWIGSQDDKGRVSNSGEAALTTAWKHYVSNPNLVSRPILLLYDCDCNQNDERFGDLMRTSIPANTLNTRIRKGIENLLPETL